MGDGGGETRAAPIAAHDVVHCVARYKLAVEGDESILLGDARPLILHEVVVQAGHSPQILVHGGKKHSVLVVVEFRHQHRAGIVSLVAVNLNRAEGHKVVPQRPVMNRLM
jgi:hypothetical protein